MVKFKDENLDHDFYGKRTVKTTVADFLAAVKTSIGLKVCEGGGYTVYGVTGEDEVSYVPGLDRDSARLLAKSMWRRVRPHQIAAWGKQ